MNKERFSTYLNDPLQMNEASLSDLQKTVANYPYFTAGRIMLLRNLHVSRDSDYEKELPLAAIYAGNRSLLYNYIFSSEIKKKREELPEPDTAPLKKEARQLVLEHKKEEIISNVSVKVTSPIIEKTEAEADIVSVQENNLLQEENSVYSFAQWLEIMGDKKIEKVMKAPVKKKSWDLIDSFIQDSPRISKHKDELPKESSPSNLATESDQQHEEFMTETLAKIYIKQKHYDKAIQIFKKLSLKYPEKSIYFAGQIKIVEQLLNNKK